MRAPGPPEDKLKSCWLLNDNVSTVGEFIGGVSRTVEILEVDQVVSVGLDRLVLCVKKRTRIRLRYAICVHSKVRF